MCFIHQQDNVYVPPMARMLKPKIGPKGRFRGFHRGVVGGKPRFSSKKNDSNKLGDFLDLM